MTIYQHPLSYLLGLEGLALLRGWAGDFDADFTRDRLAEVRRLLDDPVLTAHPGVEVNRGSAVEGYRQWAPSYDEPNGLFDFDEPFVFGIVDRLPVGDALDAACGTGRFAAGLAQRGHRVFGVDSSADMLAVARERIPAGRFEQGDLDALPVETDSIDVVVCALALSHLPTLEGAMAEFARVLRPGGQLIISDVHHELIFRGSVVMSLGPDGEPGLVPTFRHVPGDYLRAALPHGFLVRACEEPGGSRDSGAGSDDPLLPITEDQLGDWGSWPWTLMPVLPAANRAAAETAFVINWHFELAGG